MKHIKKVIAFILIGMLCISVEAKNQQPRYQIIGNSYQQEDIDQMYQIKNELLKDYKEWVKGVDNQEQALADHQDDYQATFQQGIYQIVIGQGQGKTLTGELKVNYCESREDIETKSLLWDWLFS